MWQYFIREGILTDGARNIKCYSGAYGPAKNNPDFVSHVGVGPIPIGLYTIGPAFDTVEHGPCVMRLTPQAGTNEYGRAGFLIHGDSISNPGHGSEGCICTDGPNGRADREYINNSPDKSLEVLPCLPNGSQSTSQLSA